MRRGRRGLTLLELLVAMSIMLVGIYAVAAGFPALFGTLESERIRTEMARRVEARMERLKTTTQHLPAAITGINPDPTATGPDLFIPTDIYPDESATPVPVNPRDDLTWIFGETFEVQIPQPGQSYSIHPLAMGLADGDEVPEVNLVRPLERVDAGLPLDNKNDFRIDTDGTVNAPDAFAQVRVDYVWVDADGVPHGVEDEMVDVGNQVAATMVAGPAFVNVLPELSSAVGVVSYVVIVGNDADVAAGTAVLSSDYGATLLLPAADAGEMMEVNYTLQTENYVYVDETSTEQTWRRRAPIMMEEMSSPTESPYTVDLAFRGIDDETPLFANDLLGNPLDPKVGLLVLDLTTGDTWTNADAWIDLDYVEGRVTFTWDDVTGDGDGHPSLSEVRGRDLRLFYRTIAGHTITVQKAPTSFVEQSIADQYADPAFDAYRSYRVIDDPADPLYRQILFPPSVVGQMVLVDYVVLGEDPGTGVRDVVARVNGELHPVGSLGGSPPTFGFTLNEALATDRGAVGILAVQGVSTTVRGWWHDRAGRVIRVGIDTFLTPERLL